MQSTTIYTYMLLAGTEIKYSILCVFYCHKTQEMIYLKVEDIRPGPRTLGQRQPITIFLGREGGVFILFYIFAMRLILSLIYSRAPVCTYN